MAPAILLLAFLFSSSHALLHICPIAENITPKCICKDWYEGPMMVCDKIMSPRELIVPLKEAEGHDMFSLELHDSALLYLPNKIFVGTYFKSIRLDGTSLMSLAEDDVAFEGLEDTLEEFTVVDAQFTTEWTWSHLKNLHKLSLIHVDGVSLRSIDEPFPALESLTALGITRADISYIVDNAFSELKNIMMLTLMHNEITQLSRSMFPRPAEQLMFLDLSSSLDGDVIMIKLLNSTGPHAITSRHIFFGLADNNKLDTLPSDIFSDMPALIDLNLANNEFRTLKEPVFSGVMSRTKALSLEGNNLWCDDRIEWIVNHPKPLEFDAECFIPTVIKGKSLKDVTRRDLMFINS